MIMSFNQTRCYEEKHLSASNETEIQRKQTEFLFNILLQIEKATIIPIEDLTDSAEEVSINLLFYKLIIN